MTRHDDGDRVLAVGEADSARGVLVAEEFGERAVARGRAVGDLAQRVPHAVLECGAEGFERQFEGGTGACEILLELLARAGEHRRSRPFGAGFHPGCLVRRRGPAARRREVDAGEGGVGGGEDQLTDGGAEAGEGQGHMMDNKQDFGKGYYSCDHSRRGGRMLEQIRRAKDCGSLPQGVGPASPAARRFRSPVSPGNSRAAPRAATTSTTTSPKRTFRLKPVRFRPIAYARALTRPATTPATKSASASFRRRRRSIVPATPPRIAATRNGHGNARRTGASPDATPAIS